MFPPPKPKKTHYGVYSVDGTLVKEVYTNWNECKNRINGHRCFFKGGYSLQEAEDYFNYMDKKTGGTPSNFIQPYEPKPNPFNPTSNPFKDSTSTIPAPAQIISQQDTPILKVTMNIPETMAVEFAQILNATNKAGQAPDIMLLLLSQFINSNRHHLLQPAPTENTKPIAKSSYYIDEYGSKIPEPEDDDPYLEDMPF